MPTSMKAFISFEEISLKMKQNSLRISSEAPMHHSRNFEKDNQRRLESELGRCKERGLEINVDDNSCSN